MKRAFQSINFFFVVRLLYFILYSLLASYKNNQIFLKNFSTMCCIVLDNVYIFALHSSMQKMDADKKKFYTSATKLKIRRLIGEK